MIGVLTFSACNTEELRDFSLNPQAVNEINLNFFLTPALLSAASGGAMGDNRFIDWRTNIGMCSYAIQHLASIGSFFDTGDKYMDRLGGRDYESFEAPFISLYTDPLKNLAEIIKQTGPGGYDEGNNTNLKSAARIVRAFLFARLTDCYGSIPYFDALQATTPVFYPKYDKQKDIYADILNELEEASAELDASNQSTNFKSADIIYNGDIEKWKRWGYSLMLRAAMKVSKADPNLADIYVDKAVAGGVFTSKDDNVWVPMAIGPSSWVNQNGISRAFYPGDGNQSPILSRTLVDLLKGADPENTSDDDPRLMIISGGIFIWKPSGVTLITADPLAQKGMPNGMDGGTLQIYEGVTRPVPLDSTYSKVNYLMLQKESPYMLMNYGEVELLLAEASERGLGGLSPSEAEEHYNKGVKASMQMYTPYNPTLTVSDEQVSTYLSMYPYNVSKHALEMIGEQLWVNHFFNWWEAWADWRRTGLPKLIPVNYPGNATGGTIPQRLKYPNREVIGNPQFDEGSTQPDNLTTKLWFAGGPE